MSRQQRRVSLVVGAVLLVVFVVVLGLAIATEEPASEPLAAMVAGGAAMLVGGVAFLLAGLRERIAVGGRTIEWWQLQSVGFASIGLYMSVSAFTGTTATSLYALATLAAGIGFAAFGIQQLRAGPPTESEPSVRRIATIVVGTVALVAAIALAMIWTT